MLHGKSDQRPARRIVLALLTGIIAGTALGFGLSVSGARDPDMASCDMLFGTFRVEPRDGRIVAVDTRTGEILGTPERQPEGEVWLATRDGRVRDVTACLGEKKEWFAPAPPERYGR
ncbi:hypothetical protein [Enterobacter kobei]|uniref:hypothetical protein n=1 Tax=Enterobacter kobei TaxID=208224 RepID=UPI0039C3F913